MLETPKSFATTPAVMPSITIQRETLRPQLFQTSSLNAMVPTPTLVLFNGRVLPSRLDGGGGGSGSASRRPFQRPWWPQRPWQPAAANSAPKVLALATRQLREDMWPAPQE